MDTSYSQHPGLNSEILIKGQMRFDNAFCFGNGKSRLDFDMDVIKDKGTTFGCNAIYRDMVVDHLVTVDNEITHEIYRSGYCMDNQTHIRDWNVLPMYFLDTMKEDYQDADICIKVRIEKNLVKISIDSTGEGLHKRGYKSFTGKAPMRETLASAFLKMCDFDPAQPLIDPMCGSGTFVIEAAEIAIGGAPGRRRGFSFQKLKSFDPKAFKTILKDQKLIPRLELNLFGYDRDDGAIKNSIKNYAKFYQFFD